MKFYLDESSYCKYLFCISGVLEEKNNQFGRLIGMGFYGAATFSGDKIGVHRWLKEHSSHALFGHCYCHVLQLASVQVVNARPGIKHVYRTLTLWKFFHYPPKFAESLKEIQEVLDLPELKIVKQSDSRWLTHECCVKEVKASYSSIVLVFPVSSGDSAAFLNRRLSETADKPDKMPMTFLSP